MSEQKHRQQRSLIFEYIFIRYRILKSKSYLAEWIKQIVAEMRRGFPSLVHNINYEDLVLGIILYVIDQDRLRREIPYLAEYVEKLWGKDRFQDHLRHIYMIHNRVPDIYSESF